MEMRPFDYQWKIFEFSTIEFLVFSPDSPPQPDYAKMSVPVKEGSAYGVLME
jgi:hypothetical protein